MESIAIVLLLIVLGGGALLVALIYAITTGSARTERIRRLEQDQTSVRMALNEALGRVAQLERALGDTMNRLSYLHAEQARLLERAADRPLMPPAEAAAPGAKAEAVVWSEARAAE